MDSTYWQIQSKTTPLFPNLHWSQPEYKELSGKLVIIGGSINGFNELSKCFSDANKAGAGTIKVLAPDSLKKMLRTILPEADTAISNRSGSFGSQALASWLDLAEWADATIVSGDISHNSETIILLEKFIEKCSKPLSLYGDSANILISAPLSVIDAEHILVAPSFVQLQKFLIAIKYPMAIKASLGLNQVVNLLHSLTINYKFSLLISFNNNLILAQKGLVSTTALDGDIDLNKALTYASVWRIQQPVQSSFQAMTTAIFESIQG